MANRTTVKRMENKRKKNRKKRGKKGELALALAQVRIVVRAAP